MPSPRPLAALLRGLAGGAEAARDDHQVRAELEQRPLALPRGLRITWLGTAGYRIDHEGHALLIDPYLSRVPIRDVLLRRRALPDPTRQDRHLAGVGALAGILIGHTHFDHAIDAPAIARRHGCPVLGSSSLTQLMRLHGLGEQAREVEPYRPYELGPFVVTFVPSRHSKLLLGRKVPFDGELTCEHVDRLAPSAYRCGQVFGIHVEVAGLRIYHQGSADLIDDAIRHRDVDLFLAGIAGRSVTRDYWPRILGRLRPQTVVPSHFDDFFRPLEAPMGFSKGVQLAAFPDEIAAVSREIELASLPLLEPRSG
ncbi:MBL fold metallo-hydrolase [Patulibacter defluvii]|uniref:MBL fold metallo-hydrolase n=1 Tax=Patulibacter defluvii TaxID=3095358 RepID=UPI002A74B012|nr:MBL fold metallo-hydrolase [Patulibacter sp. DM4]